MIQNFKSAYWVFKNSRSRKAVIIMMITFSILLWLFNNQSLNTNQDLESKILSNIFDFSAIFSGLLIAFIIGKVFQLRNENLKRKEKIDIISNKITHLRRICKTLLSNWQIWSDIRDPLSKHKDLRYFDFYRSILVKPHLTSSKKVSKFLDDEHIKTETVSKFFLALKDISLSDYSRYLGGELILYDEYDRNIDYPLELLELWAHSNIANQFWYCLIERRSVSEHYFFLNNLNQDDSRQIKRLCEKIDSKYSNRELNHELLSDIGNDFDQYYLPEIFNLSYINNLANNSISFTSNILIVVILMGVLVPLILLSFNIPFQIKYFLTYSCVASIALALVWFSIKIKSILMNELEINY